MLKFNIVLNLANAPRSFSLSSAAHLPCRIAIYKETLALASGCFFDVRITGIAERLFLLLVKQTVAFGDIINVSGGVNQTGFIV